jgi:hypothetical protein
MRIINDKEVSTATSQSTAYTNRKVFSIEVRTPS